MNRKPKVMWAMRMALLLLLTNLIVKTQALNFTFGNLNYATNVDGGVTVIGHVDGQNATGNLSIPSSVTWNDITYPVTAIGMEAFYGCSGLTGDLILPNSITTIGPRAFIGCSGFTGDLVIPNSVTTINSWAFYNCYGFTGSLIIGESVIIIGDNAFLCCSGFTGDLNIPSSVITIEDNAFKYCSGFNGNLVFSNSVTTIGSGAFNHCSGFTGNLIIPNSVTTIGSGAFNHCNGFTGTLTLSESLTTINQNVFYYCDGFTGDLIIPNYVTTISNGAFAYCSGFTGNLIIPNSVTTINNSAFANCSGLTGDLIIPNSVTIIGSCAFENCTGFTGNLTIGESVTTISVSAFYHCNGLTGSLTIGESVTNIGGYAFHFCTGLTSIVALPSTPAYIVSSSFNGINTMIPIYVPCESLELYASANWWNAFDNYIGFDCPNYDIIGVVNPAESGIIIGSGTYPEGSTCTLTAIANEGYCFVNWTIDNMVLSNNSVYSFTVTEDAEYTANFSPVYIISLNDELCYGEDYYGNGFNIIMPPIGQYFDTLFLSTTQGCDSIVTLTLTVNPVYDIALTDEICFGEDYNLYGFSFEAPSVGVHTQTLNLQTVNECDSIVTMTLTVNPTYDITLTDEICFGEDYNLYGFNFEAPSVGVHTQTLNLQTVNECDSIVTMTLTVFDTPFITISGDTIVQSGQSVTLTAYGAETYLWSTGEITESIVVTPNETTTYSVIGIDSYGCYGNAEITVTIVSGISENDLNSTIKIYPNPTQNNLIVEGENMKSITIVNSHGMIVYKIWDINNMKCSVDLSKYYSGIYYLKIATVEGETIRKIVKY